MMSGETRFALDQVHEHAQPDDGERLPPPLDAPSTNSAGSSVETSVPKNGTMAASAGEQAERQPVGHA